MKKAIITILFIVLFSVLLYDIYIYFSIKNESENRLTRHGIQQKLSPVLRYGDSKKPAILLLHGFGGSPHDFRPLIDQLPENYTVSAPVLPGHSLGNSKELSRYNRLDWRNAAQENTHNLLERHHEIILCGFSLGGLVALDIAPDFPVHAVILINPYTSIPYKPYYILPVELWVDLLNPFIPYSKKIHSGQINFPDGRKRYEPSYWHISLKAYKELQFYSDIISNKTKPLKTNVYFHFSKEDGVSSPEKMLELASKMNIRKERIYIWPHSNHNLLYDFDSKDAIDQIIKNIKTSEMH
ncbi:MAG: alpha/beta fold hydrolase [Candidatus Electrothrix sp. MAN1_4]|nr:alpha/beta fold hydrolase [Candidatus Electrothrix sp. MAN1_4]